MFQWGDELPSILSCLFRFDLERMCTRIRIVPDTCYLPRHSKARLTSSDLELIILDLLRNIQRRNRYPYWG